MQDTDAFIQAAKRTPVNLQEWAISMMEQHNRKSYLAPPAPKHIARDGSSDAVSYSDTPTSAEVPLNYAGESSPSMYSDTPTATKVPPTLGIEHLSIGSYDQINGGGGERTARPANTAQQSSEAYLYSSPRSSNPYPPRQGAPSGTLPIRAAPPPTGPLPAPPGSAGTGSWRSQGHRV